MHFKVCVCMYKYFNFPQGKRANVISGGFGSSSEIVWSSSGIFGSTLEVLGNLREFSVILRILL